MSFEGIYTALVTPFRDEGGVDEGTFRKLIERQIESGTHGLIISGSTGEGLTQTENEWTRALQISLDYRKEIKIFGSCGQSGTQASLEKFKRLYDLGADGALISTPAYNKPPQRGLVEHFLKIAKAAPLPIMVYNIPGRTAVNLLPTTMRELWKVENIIALKESSGSFEQFLQMLSDQREMRPTASTFIGEDALNFAAFASGARGTVSVLSNIVPRATSKLWKLCQTGLWKEAQEVHERLLPLIHMLFVESNPIPAKWCLSHLLKIELKPRLPLVTLDPTHTAKLKGALDQVRDLGFL